MSLPIFPKHIYRYPRTSVARPTGLFLIVEADQEEPWCFLRSPGPKPSKMVGAGGLNGER